MTQATAPNRSGTLSVSQMLDLMGVEVDSARLHGYPVSCLMIQLDGYRGEGDETARRHLLPAVFSALKAVTFEHKARGMGLTKDPYILAVFPHVLPDRLGPVAEALLERARSIELPEEPERAVTLSIGVAHNQHPEVAGLLELIQDAEVGLGLSRDAGGDRATTWREVRTETDRMREELEQQLEALALQEVRSADQALGEDRDWGQALIGKILDAFASEDLSSRALVKIEHTVLGLVRAELEAWRARFGERQSERERQIDVLERRIQKLTRSLSETEKELKRVAAMKAVDTGLSSIYRNVQGLSDDDENAGQKKEMLKNIFEENLKLRG